MKHFVFSVLKKYIGLLRHFISGFFFDDAFESDLYFYERISWTPLKSHRHLEVMTNVSLTSRTSLCKFWIKPVLRELFSIKLQVQLKLDSHYLLRQPKHFCSEIWNKNCNVYLKNVFQQRIILTFHVSKDPFQRKNTSTEESALQRLQTMYSKQRFQQSHILQL